MSGYKLFIYLLFIKGGLALQCYEGLTHSNGSLGDFTSTTCGTYQEMCFSLHTAEGEGVELKMCWDKAWENERYKNLGCFEGQHCIAGVCYNNTVVCLCNEDNCNAFMPNGSYSTVEPVIPTTPTDQHWCYYSVKENHSSSGLEYTEQCTNNEHLCLVVKQEKDGYEYRSCYDGSLEVEFSRPGCYKGFKHCHRDICHNDTVVCVCAENLCNELAYTSEAPPITPGSGLYCYSGDWEEEEYEKKACAHNENYCIEFFSVETTNVYRDCWDPAYSSKFDYVGCEITQSCWRGRCFNSTVCICQDELCNGYGLDGVSVSTPVPVPMTTTNTTMHCFYGNANDSDVIVHWTDEVCAPEEDRCILYVNSDGFQMGQCYDVKYNDGKYLNGTYDLGEYCFDGSCFNGTVYVCLSPLCNEPDPLSTPAPHPTTPGSGLDCWYALNTTTQHTNLTQQICHHKETLCIAVYGDNDFFMGSCWDPASEDGKYEEANVCSGGLHCWHHEDGTQSCMNGTVCTCNTAFCNTFNVSSTLPTERPTTTNARTTSCWFGEKHPNTGEEDWKVEVCDSNEHYCFQFTSGEGKYRTESRECWDLSYEDNHFSGPGCYKEDVYHDGHHYYNATICICKGPLCNGWTPDGNITTFSPVLPGSGLLCEAGSAKQHQVKECTKYETKCMAYTTDQSTIMDCYNVKSNDGHFKNDTCFDKVDIEQTGDMLPEAGRLCLCSGDLCNTEYLEGGAVHLALHLLLLLPVLSLPYWV